VHTDLVAQAALGLRDWLTCAPKSPSLTVTEATGFAVPLGS
jgi:hypothetical protein